MPSLSSSDRFRVLLTCTPQKPQAWGLAGTDFPQEQRAAYEQAAGSLARFVDEPDAAELIVFFEPWQLEEQVWQPGLRGHPLVRSRPEDCFVVCNDDVPLGFLPGVYASMPRARFDPLRHRAWQYGRSMNHVLNHEDDPPTFDPPALLASFSGARTHACRQKLFECADLFPSSIKLTETQNLQFNINPSSADKRRGQLAFIEQMKAARFSLCPRGVGTSSFRIQESMQLGRAPIIISDDWVPPEGPAWSDCSLHLAESRIAELPVLLERLAPRWEEMGRAARLNWERYFKPVDYARHVIDTIVHLWLSKPRTEQFVQSRWEEMMWRHRLQVAARPRSRLKARTHLLRLALRSGLNPAAGKR